MLIIVGGYFALSMLQNVISSSGAFEIFINGNLIFSKLNLNRMPTISDLDQYL
jgi:selT/selW/selH-like putative selenoprotein